LRRRGRRGAKREGYGKEARRRKDRKTGGERQEGGGAERKREKRNWRQMIKGGYENREGMGGVEVLGGRGRRGRLEGGEGGGGGCVGRRVEGWRDEENVSVKGTG